MSLDPAIAGLLVAFAIGAMSGISWRPAGWVGSAASLLLVLVAAFLVAGTPLLAALGLGLLAILAFNTGLIAALWLRYRTAIA